MKILRKTTKRTCVVLLCLRLITWDCEPIALSQWQSTHYCGASCLGRPADLAPAHLYSHFAQFLASKMVLISILKEKGSKFLLGNCLTWLDYFATFLTPSRKLSGWYHKSYYHHFQPHICKSSYTNLFYLWTVHVLGYSDRHYTNHEWINE
jgi:hypothetical protein